MTADDTAVMNGSEGGDLPMDLVEHRIANWLCLYVAPSLLIVGVAGNTISLVVLLGEAFRKSSLSFTLGVLAVVDTAVLCTALPRQWIMFLTDEQTDIRTSTGALGCKLHFFLTYYLSHLSSWTVVIVTIERAFHVARPITAKVRVII